MLEAPWPLIESCKVREGWLLVLRDCPTCITAEHFVDEFADTGISNGCLTGTNLDGTKIEVRGCDFYTFRLGRVIQKNLYWRIVERG